MHLFAFTEITAWRAEILMPVAIILAVITEFEVSDKIRKCFTKKKLLRHIQIKIETLNSIIMTKKK